MSGALLRRVLNLRCSDKHRSEVKCLTPHHFPRHLQNKLCVEIRILSIKTYLNKSDVLWMQSVHPVRDAKRDRRKQKAELVSWWIFCFSFHARCQEHFGNCRERLQSVFQTQRWLNDFELPEGDGWTSLASRRSIKGWEVASLFGAGADKLTCDWTCSHTDGDVMVRCEEDKLSVDTCEIMTRYKNSGQTKTLSPTCCSADSVCSYINDYRLKVSSLCCKLQRQGKLIHPRPLLLMVCRVAGGPEGGFTVTQDRPAPTRGPTRGPTRPQCSHTVPLTFWCVPEDRWRRARPDCHRVNLQV